MNGRRVFPSGSLLMAGMALSALDAAASSVTPRYRDPEPQTAENASAQRSAAEAKRRRKNSRRAALAEMEAGR
jgi:hypothetical protein